MNAPSLTELSGKHRPDRPATLRETTNADEEQDTHQVIKTPKVSLIKVNATDQKEVNIALPETPNANLQSDALITDLALATIPARQPRHGLFSK